MVSPFVRRQQLAVALAQARDAAGMTHSQLAHEVGQSRQQISRLENAHVRPDQAAIFKILDILGVEGEQWSHLVEIASDAADKGWWHSYGDDMGSRQALYADLESGARLIREFQPFIPGLLQTVDFAHQRQIAEWDAEGELETARSQRRVEARQSRQKMLLRPGGPSYEVVLDEVAIRRLPAPPEVVAAQLRRLIEMSDDPDITLRILPVDARIAGYRVSRSAFSIYSYPGSLDPEVVAVDTVTTDVVLTTLTEEPQVRRYTDLYARLADAALSAEKSIDYLASTADHITQGVQ